MIGRSRKRIRQGWENFGTINRSIIGRDGRVRKPMWVGMGTSSTQCGMVWKEWLGALVWLSGEMGKGGVTKMVVGWG